ncbi:MAG: hypothetical protein HOW97_36280, partial [Catenulispora sp.]|nr:hypothetical protein [Catenulispora sp.]
MIGVVGSVVGLPETRTGGDVLGWPPEEGPDDGGPVGSGVEGCEPVGVAVGVEVGGDVAVAGEVGPSDPGFVAGGEPAAVVGPAGWSGPVGAAVP